MKVGYLLFIAKAKKLIKWVSRESDTYGYDIKSVNPDMTPRYIEVKATQRNVGNMDFFYTENEFETAKKFGKDYYLYIVFEILTSHPKVWVIRNPFDDGVGINMKPVKYKNVLHTHAHCRAIKSYCIVQLSFIIFKN